jgi:hypothetical protein
MRRDHGPAVRGVPGSEQRDRHVSLGRARQRGPQCGPVPDGLEYQRDHPRLRQAERVVQVSGRRRDQLLAGGDRQREAELPARAQQRGEHRAGVGDECDRAIGHRIGLGVADGSQSAADVDEAHAAGPAQLHACAGCDGGQAFPQCGAIACARWLVGAAEDDGGSGAVAGREAELLLERRVRDREQHQVDRFWQLRERGVAATAVELAVPGVDRVEARSARAPACLLGHAAAERTWPRRGAHQRDAPRLEHRGQRGSRARRDAPGALSRAPEAFAWDRDRHARRVRLATFLSAIAALAACQPGMPQTPPPACVAELP